MHSASSDTPAAIPPAQELWLAERQAAATAAFAARIPALYQQPIALHPRVAQWAAAGRNQTGSLFLTGPLGVGKTHSAWTAARDWVAACFGGAYRGNPTVEAWRSTQLFDALRPDAAAGQGRDLIPSLQAVDLLYIDDLAAARPSAWTQERLFELFDERYIQRRPVLITCDVLPNALAEIVGPRVSSRLAEMCRDHVVGLSGADRRAGGAR